MLTSAQIRQAFLDYFSERDHEIVPSSSLVPANDPTLLFTNAGMVPFKDVFLGREQRGYTRAASSQRCVRAGGKHNDLDQVGYTARHHTFFEMLGNFSFGDYFKRAAIQYAWEFLTRVVELPPERLWVTVYEDDDEAAAIWLEEIGVPAERFRRIGAHDNFWSMGDTGPCGPCSEIFYDHGPGVPGGPPGSEDEDGDRYVEVWNLVFMQYDRAADGSMTSLPKPCVDTGMGLERLAAILQGKHDNYEIDLFQSLMAAASRLAGYDRPTDNSSLRVIADHIRACAFLIVDGVLPSNEGRGYVLRRIIRRAIRHGYQLGIRDLFFHKMVGPLDEEMGEAFPELHTKREHVERVLEREEERFAETLDQGMRLLERTIDALEGTTIPGEAVFKLYDTYGFPVDLTADIARERGLTVDQEGFDREMAAQRQRAQAASKFAGSGDVTGIELDVEPTEFLGYDEIVTSGAKILALLQDGEETESLEAGQEGIVVLDRTPFYAESGGQVGDTGELTGVGATFEVEDTQKMAGRFTGHIGRVSDGTLTVGMEVTAKVDGERRQAIVLNHSATHLLNAALREVLGDHVDQKGSLVAPDRLRFDFSHYEALTDAELQRIEDRVNEEIRSNADAEIRYMPLQEAMDAGAIALFDEKYGDNVRVLRLGDFSMELCGGTHVQRVGDIGLFKITHETGIAAGVRRIEALTGERALQWVRDSQQRVEQIADIVRANPGEVEERVRQLVDRSREMERELERLKQKLASSTGDDLASRAVDVDGCKVLAATIDGADVKTLRDTVDQLKNKLGSAAVVLAGVSEGRVHLVAGVTKDRTDTVRAGDLVNVVAERVGGRGGGRADMAQAGGKNPEALPQALEVVPEWVRQRLDA